MLVSIILFGSVARGTQTDESDIDIAVMLRSEENADMKERMTDIIVDLELEYNKVLSVLRIDYEKLIDYFDSMETCHINYYEDVVEMVYTDPVFDFPYRFLITKRSQVKSIYNLNVDYFNINLLVEIPILLPSSFC